MIPENYKTSLSVSLKQLPQFIRDDSSYEKFISFIKAYYSWLETSNNIEDRSKNIINYKDVDETIDEFEDYFFNQFLQYFPEETYANKRELVKLSSKFYANKSTASSFKFLFRALFNSDCEVYNTRESILTASSGNWIRSQFIRISTIDPRFQNITGYKIFGTLSKSTATILKTQIISGKTEVYISDSQREFTSGESIVVVDDNLNPIEIDGEILTAKIIGSVVGAYVNPNYKGLSYSVGDPVLFLGNLNSLLTNSSEAFGLVSKVTTGSIKNVKLISAGNGYRIYPNSTITIAGSGTGAEARITEVDTTKPSIISFVSTETVSTYSNVLLNAVSLGFSGNPSANANTKISEALDFISEEVYPIKTIELVSGGKNYSGNTTTTINSYIQSDGGNYNIRDFGILSPIKINYSGANYSNGDIINILGGTGIGAFANVKSVDSNGAIKEVQYVYNTNFLSPLGGTLYTSNLLPTVSVESQNNKIIHIVSSENSIEGNSEIYVSSTTNVKVGMYISGLGIQPETIFNYFQSNTKITEVDYSNNIIKISNVLTQNVNSGNSYIVDGTAILKIDSVLGDGASAISTADTIGEVIEIEIKSAGENYIGEPLATLRVIDIAVKNVDETDLPNRDDILYQGDANYPNFNCYVYSIELVPDQIEKTFVIRAYDYSGTINSTQPLYIDRTEKNSKELLFNLRTTYSPSQFSNGIKIYGNGEAKANTNFLSGTVFLTGKYLNEEGFLSSSNVLESDIYNEYTYTLTVEKEFKKYKNLLYNIIHPAGTKVSTRNAINSTGKMSILNGQETHKLVQLKELTHPDVYGVLTDTNRFQVLDLNKESTSVYLSSVLGNNTFIRITSTNGEQVYSQIESIDDTNDIIYLKDHTILNLYEVALGYSNSNNIIVSSLTGQYNIVNGGNYSNTENYLRDIIFVGDRVSIPNNSETVINTIDYTGWILSSNTEFVPSGSNNSLISISVFRNFVSNNIVVDYNVSYKVLQGSGNTISAITVDGLYLTDEYDNIIYLLTEN